MRGRSYVLSDTSPSDVGRTEERCGSRNAKAIVHGANVIVFIMCCVVLGVSLWALGQDESLWTLVDLSHLESSAASFKSARAAAILLIVAAVFTLILVLFGSYAAAKEDKMLLLVFVCLMVAFLLAVLTGAVLAANSDAEEALEDPLLASMAQYDEEATGGEDKEVTDAWDDVQQEYLCCGFDSYLDWPSNCPSLSSPKPFRVPAVCCTNIATEAGVNIDACRRNPSQYLAAGKVGEDVGRGCGVPLANNLEDEGDVVLWTAVGATIIMILDLLAAGYLYLQMASV